jgi:hypothetical protein
MKWSNITAPVALSVTATLIGGGAMGSLITWYVNRPNPAVITYTIATTTVTDTSSASSIIPNLRVQLGSEEVKALYAHTIEFNPTSGRYVESADVGVTFPPDVKVFGPPIASVPSVVRHIDCTPVAGGAVCRLSPIKPRSGPPFKVTFATDRKQAPSVESAARDVELQTLVEFAARPSFIERYGYYFFGVTISWFFFDFLIPVLRMIVGRRS